MRMSNNHDSFVMNRRRFLYGTSLGAALFHIAPGHLLGAERLAANDKLNVAGIGIGSQGGADVDAVAGEGQNIVALCDVDDQYAAKKFAQYPKARQFKDFRVMLDQMDKEIDAVVIGTPDHTHAVIAMEAMKRGKHVYCEKPLAHTVHEVRALMAAARKYKVVTQLGNQGHSSGSIRRLCEWVWAGAIGQVHTVHAGCDAFKEVYCQLRNLDKLDQTYEVPKGLDYDLWIGPVPFRPYTPFWVPWNWRGWMPFGTGTIGDWFCHVIDPSFWALDLDAPSTVQAEVTDYDPAKQGLTYPPATKITFEFPARRQARPGQAGLARRQQPHSQAGGFRGGRQGAGHRGHPLWRQGDDRARLARRRRLPAAAGETHGAILGQECARPRRSRASRATPGTGSKRFAPAARPDPTSATAVRSRRPRCSGPSPFASPAKRSSGTTRRRDSPTTRPPTLISTRRIARAGASEMMGVAIIEALAARFVETFPLSPWATPPEFRLQAV